MSEMAQQKSDIYLNEGPGKKLTDGHTGGHLSFRVALLLKRDR